MFPSHDIVPAAALHARQAGVVSLLGNGTYLGTSTITICAPGVAVPTPANYLPYTTVYTTEYIQVCPTETPCAKGTKTETFTITQTCSGGKEEFTPPAIPPNFTTVVQVCDACAGKPTLTVTCPVAQVTGPAVCSGPGCPVSPPVKSPCPGPDCPPTPPPGSPCPGPDCPLPPPPGSQCPGPNCPPANTPCPGPNCPPANAPCPGPNCPPTPPSVCPGPSCPSTQSNSTTPPYISANSGSNGHIHIVAILLGASVGLAAFYL
ncbi:hypothetical protein ONS95_011041 [Cadophora gregata]|uniref:uncharacterized protein n=1 Tax=Cadophora gregata TaxID=51156 RepID=UPI0026DAE734|nr:uncharacterized protein ONS95_011041 [Cadophora gregata]KAK0119601.1 hypothetical protein ONS95_011041 [Cadophora gregata]